MTCKVISLPQTHWTDLAEGLSRKDLVKCDPIQESNVNGHPDACAAGHKHACVLFNSILSGLSIQVYLTFPDGITDVGRFSRRLSQITQDKSYSICDLLWTVSKIPRIRPLNPSAGKAVIQTTAARLSTPEPGSVPSTARDPAFRRGQIYGRSHSRWFPG